MVGELASMIVTLALSVCPAMVSVAAVAVTSKYGPAGASIATGDPATVTLVVTALDVVFTITPNVPVSDALVGRFTATVPDSCPAIPAAVRSSSPWPFVTDTPRSGGAERDAHIRGGDRGRRRAVRELDGREREVAADGLSEHGQRRAGRRDREESVRRAGRCAVVPAVVAMGAVEVLNWTLNVPVNDTSGIVVLSVPETSPANPPEPSISVPLRVGERDRAAAERQRRAGHASRRRRPRAAARPRSCRSTSARARSAGRSVIENDWVAVRRHQRARRRWGWPGS